MKRTLSILLVLLMAIGIFASCTAVHAPEEVSQAPAEATAEASEQAPAESPVVETSTEATEEVAYTPETYPWPEAYLIDDPSFWGGMRLAKDYMSRDHIEKALPTATKTPDQIKVGVITSQTGNTFFEQLLVEAENMKGVYGYDVSYLSANNDIDKMNRAMEDYTAQGVDVIVLDPVDNNAADIAIRNCVDNGVAVMQVGIAMGRDVPGITSITGNYWGNAYENIKSIYNFPEIQELLTTGDKTIKAVFSIGRLGSGHRSCGTLTAFIEMATGCTKAEAMLQGYNYTKSSLRKGTWKYPKHT